MSVFDWTAPLLKMAGRRWTQEDFAELASRLRPHVPPGGTLADLGGGTGELGVGIAGALGARVIVVDPTRQMLMRVDAHPHVSVRLAPAEDLPFPDGYFHGLLCSDAFHHLRDQQAAAREIARVVRPAGGVMMMELAPGRVLPFLERMLGEPAAFLSPAELETLFAGVGIEGTATFQRHGYLYVGTVGCCGSGADAASPTA